MRRLLTIARTAIEQAFERCPTAPHSDVDAPAALHEYRGNFVTLTLSAQLRGCIGSLEPTRPLASDVAHNAIAAAFKDPRFARVRRSQLDGLEYHVAVLSSRVSLKFDSFEALASQLRPGIDGLVLEFEGQKATFLPRVWDTIEDRLHFVTRLLSKARIAPNVAPKSVTAATYSVQEITDSTR